MDEPAVLAQDGEMSENSSFRFREVHLELTTEAEAFRRSFRRYICPSETCRKCLGRNNLRKSIGYQALSLANLR